MAGTAFLLLLWGRELVFRAAAAKDLADHSQGLNFMLPSYPFWPCEKEAIHNTGLSSFLPGASGTQEPSLLQWLCMAAQNLGPQLLAK